MTGIASNKLNRRIGRLINPKKINEPIIPTGKTTNKIGRTASNNIITGIVVNANVTKM